MNINIRNMNKIEENTIIEQISETLDIVHIYSIIKNNNKKTERLVTNKAKLYRLLVVLKINVVQEGKKNEKR